MPGFSFKVGMKVRLKPSHNKTIYKITKPYYGAEAPAWYLLPADGNPYLATEWAYYEDSLIPVYDPSNNQKIEEQYAKLFV